jgi:predicted aldo/keto reductase-like oxidoreductase
VQYRRLGKTGLDVSVIGYGAIKLPKIDEEAASRCLNRALDLGVNFVDTARGYKDSEAKIGKALKSRRSEYHLATKTTARDADSLTAELDTSLRELQTDVVDLFQLHSVSDEETWQRVTGPGGALEGAQRARQAGKLRHLGVSIHRAVPVMRKAIECGEFETLMVAYSPLDQEGVAAEILPLAKRHDVGVIIMKGLSGGLLTTPDWHAQHPDEPDPLVAGALRYVLANDSVTCVIPGMAALTEVEQNVPLGYGAIPMSEEEKRRFFARLGGLNKEFRYGQVCLRCGYCMPCPQGIDVPEVFRALDVYQSYPENLRRQGLVLYQSLDVKPGECAECRECLADCPAGLDIPARLKGAAEVLEAAAA